MARLRDRLTYANVMSTLAVFLVLGGASAFAAKQLADRSVGERQLRPGAVTASKLRKNAVIAPKIKALAVKTGKLANGSVKAEKLAAGAVTGEKIAAAAVTGEKIAAEAISGDKIVESSLGLVPSANRANFATSADSADPTAFAEVDADGEVDQSNSKGVFVSNDVSPAIGIYCVRAVGFNPRGAQATLGQSAATTVQVRLGGPQCPLPEVEVLTLDGGTLVKSPFFIVLYR